MLIVRIDRKLKAVGKASEGREPYLVCLTIPVKNDRLFDYG